MKTNHDEIAEKHVIGTMLNNADTFSYAFSTIPPELFFLKRNRDIFETMASMFRAGEAIDPVTIRLKPGMDQHFEYIKDLIMDCWEPVGFNVNLERIKTLKYKRDAFAFASLLLEGIDNLSPDDISERIEGFVTDKHESKTEQHFYNAKDLMNNQKKTLEEIKAGTSPMISTGYPSIDERIYGFENGKMYVIGARPGMGKSMLMLEMAKKCGGSAVIFSTEMSKGELSERLIAAASGLPLSALKYKDGIIRNEETIARYMEQVANYDFIVDDRPDKTVEQIVSDIRYLKMRQKVDIVFIDYIQYLKAPDHKRGRRLDEINHISMSIKSAAKTFDIPFVVLASLHRYEGQVERRPRAEDLRESGQIESDAHCVMLLHRDPACKEFEIETVEIIMGKCRNANETPVKLLFDKPRCRFNEMGTGTF